MSFGNATLSLSSAASHQDALLLAGVQAGLRLCRENGWQTVPTLDALRCFDTMTRASPSGLRAFVAEAKLSSFPLSTLTVSDLQSLVRTSLKNGNAMVLRQGEPGSDQTNNQTAEQRRLIKAIDSKSRGHLNFSGRQFRLVAGEDLKKLPHRDRYEVVRREEAIRILDGIAKQPASAPSGLPALLSDAREKLTRDWGPQFQPDGLVLLRQIVSVGTKKTLEMAALTPSALKKLRDEGWVEIMFVDAGMEPLADVDYSVRLADGQVKSGKTNKEGLARFDEIQPGDCEVRFPKVEGPIVQV